MVWACGQTHQSSPFFHTISPENTIHPDGKREKMKKKRRADFRLYFICCFFFSSRDSPFRDSGPPADSCDSVLLVLLGYFELLNTFTYVPIGYKKIRVQATFKSGLPKGGHTVAKQRAIKSRVFFTRT